MKNYSLLLLGLIQIVLINKSIGSITYKTKIKPDQFSSHQTYNRYLAQSIVSSYCKDPFLALSIIKVESNFNNVKSKEGSLGLMQVKYSTAQWIKCSIISEQELMNPIKNIQCGCKYLNILKNKYSNKKDVIASYNAGSPRLCRTGHLLPSNTKCTIGLHINNNYISKVLLNL